jgi:hypothetical protein
MKIYNVKNFAYTTLLTTLPSGSTEMYVEQINQFLEPPALCLLARSRSLRDLTLGELIEITDIDSDHYVVVRSKAVDHIAGTFVLGNMFAEHYEQILENQERLSTIIARSFGTQGYGIVRTNAWSGPEISPDADLKFVSIENGFDFKVMPGYGFVRRPDLSGKYMYTSLPVEIGTEQDFTGELVDDKEYTVYIDQNSEIQIVEGLKEVKEPAGIDDLTLENLAIAQITIPVGSVDWVSPGVVIDDKRFFF